MDRMIPKMDDRTVQAEEVAKQRELMKNERVIQHPTLGAVKLMRPNPDQEMAISEVRRRQYHADFQDRTILSRAEMRAEALRRGIWTMAQEEKVTLLQTRIGQIMGLLNVVGYQSVDEVIQKFDDATAALAALFAEKPEAQAAVRRYFDINERPDPADHKLIFESATTTAVDDAMSEATLYRTQVELLTELASTRKELQPLMREQVRLFMDTIEARMDRKEELAKVYYCTSTPEGAPLWPTFEAMFRASPSALEVLLEEMYFFEHGISDADRLVLSRHSFTLRAPTTEASSDDSPGAPTSNSSGESLPSAPTSSSATTASAT
jgi:hypothetical protein